MNFDEFLTIFNTFVNVVGDRTPGKTKPPRMVLTSGIPDPLAAGATVFTITTAINPYSIGTMMYVIQLKK